MIEHLISLSCQVQNSSTEITEPFRFSLRQSRYRMHKHRWEQDMSDTFLARRTWFKSCFFAAFLGLASCGPDFGQVTPPAQGAAQLTETGRVYALVETPAEVAQLEASALALGYRPSEEFDLGGLGLIMLAIDLPEGVTGGAAIVALEQAVPTSTVGVNHAYRLQQPKLDIRDNPTRPSRNFANDMMQWPAGGCQARRAIGLIDGGVDTSVPNLADVDVRQRAFSGGSTETLRHGTEVASILVDPSRIRDVILYSANVMATDAGGEDLAGASDLVLAIDWMVQQNVTLVNVSLAGPRNKLLSQAVEAAAEQGVQLVAAVGNTGRFSDPQHPAALPQVVAVTAVDANDQIYRDAVRGTHVDFAAPGVDVFVSLGQVERFVSGTSMAAPFVTTLLATMDRQNPQALIGTAMDLGVTGRDQTFGHGLVQAVGGCQ